MPRPRNLERRAEVEALVKKNPEATLAEMAVQLGVTSMAVSKMLRSLGYIAVRTRRWRKMKR